VTLILLKLNEEVDECGLIKASLYVRHRGHLGALLDWCLRMPVSGSNPGAPSDTNTPHINTLFLSPAPSFPQFPFPPSLSNAHGSAFAARLQAFFSHSVVCFAAHNGAVGPNCKLTS
jgi:hypothetical protein